MDQIQLQIFNSLMGTANNLMMKGLSPEESIAKAKEIVDIAIKTATAIKQE